MFGYLQQNSRCRLDTCGECRDFGRRERQARSAAREDCGAFSVPAFIKTLEFREFPAAANWTRMGGAVAAGPERGKPGMWQESIGLPPTPYAPACCV